MEILKITLFIIQSSHWVLHISKHSDIITLTRQQQPPQKWTELRHVTAKQPPPHYNLMQTKRQTLWRKL